MSEKMDRRKNLKKEKKRYHNMRYDYNTLDKSEAKNMYSRHVHRFKTIG
jgi:hypothetical protein